MRLPGFVLGALVRWAKRHTEGRHPDVVINTRGVPYLCRWYVWPPSARRSDPRDNVYRTVKGNWFGLYVHRFLQSDEDWALHDHPRHNVSVVLERGYWEHIGGRRVWRAPGSVVFRRATTPHRIELEYQTGLPRYSHEALSLFILGPRVREWGFHCPNGWVDQRVFHSMKSDGSMRGCSDETDMCEDCGKYPADFPSRLCAGCEAYREHTGAI